MKTIFISAGEASGDMHAAALISALTARSGGLRFFGLGGELSAAKGVELLYDLRDLAVTGFWEVAKRILHFRKVFNFTLSEIDKRKPDLAILIDYPGMNLRLAEQLHRRGIKVVYYIAPQVWAWKKGRIAHIERDVDLLLSILPFENELFDPSKLRCEFVGHPLLDMINNQSDAGDFRNQHAVQDQERIIALLPGSRPNEVHSHYAIMLKTISLLQSQGIAARVFTAVRDELGDSIYSEAEREIRIAPEHVSDARYGLLKSADVSIVSSGTATLEAALCRRPFCVVYRTGWITYQIARRIIKLKNVGLANIVAGREVVPEFLQYAMTPENLSCFCLEVLNDKSKSDRMTRDLCSIRERLGRPGASDQAANLISEMFLS